jgi:succinyl-CoA synthetase beta subunit
MKFARFAVLAAVAAAGLSVGFVDEAAAAKKKPATCTRIGGSATGITSDIAKDLATMSVKESISAKGMKGVGKLSMKCSKDPVMTECKASQKACK